MRRRDSLPSRWAPRDPVAREVRFEDTSPRIAALRRKLDQDKAEEIAFHRRMQVTAASGAGGAVVVGAGCAGVGFLAGGAVGTALGFLPALLTFGLSVPLGAALGAGCGMATGGALGGTAGFAGAAAIGYGASAQKDPNGSLLTMRLEAACSRITYRAAGFSRCAVAKVSGGFAALRGKVQPHVGALEAQVVSILGSTKAKIHAAAGAAWANMADFSSDKDVQVAAASACGGALVLGTGAAATGLVAGSAIGAAVGLVPAILTFGLSVPIGAFLGGSCGLATGTVVGGTTGAAAGAGGYCAYKRRSAICRSTRSLADTALTSARRFHKAMLSLAKQLELRPEFAGSA